MAYLDFRKWIYIDIRSPFKTMKKLKGIFKPLKCYFRYSFNEYLYYPVLWCSKPAYIHIMSYDVLWKDKNESPQYEYPPVIWIHLYKLNLIWYWDLQLHDKDIHTDDYWEQALWYLYYSDKDINKAKKTWPWSDYYSKKSTWNDKFLMK